MADPALIQRHWSARLQLELRSGPDRTRLVPLSRYGPLSVQRPFYPEGECCHVYVLHPPGGVVGGDRLELMIEAKTRAQGLFTTPGATKFYRSAGDTARIRHRYDLDADAGIEILPQESIYFSGARVDAETTINVETGARLLLWEKHCFGRPSNNERFEHGNLRSKIELRSKKEPIFRELQRVNSAEIQRTSGFRGQAVAGTLLAYGMDFDDNMVEQLRRSTPGQGMAGITRVRNDLVLARYLGPDTADIDTYFLQLRQTLRPRLLFKAPHHPRIWNT